MKDDYVWWYAWKEESSAECKHPYAGSSQRVEEGQEPTSALPGAWQMTEEMQEPSLDHDGPGKGPNLPGTITKVCGWFLPFQKVGIYVFI